MKIVCFNRTGQKNTVCGHVVIMGFKEAQSWDIVCPKCGGRNTVDGVSDNWKPADNGLVATN